MSLPLLFLILSALRPKEELKFASGREQDFDTSCGLSAAVCLMSDHWGVETDEMELAGLVLADKIATGDFSVTLADIVEAVVAKGFVARAYRMSFEELRAAVGKYPPVLVHYAFPDGHFALALAMRGDYVIVADPASGTAALARGAFTKAWSGAVLLAARKEGRRDGNRIAEAIAAAYGRIELLERGAP